MRKPLKVGDTVRLSAATRRGSAEDNDPRHAQVFNLFGSRGGVHLDVPLAGFPYWNEADLSIVRRANPNRKVRVHHEKT